MVGGAAGAVRGRGVGQGDAVVVGVDGGEASAGSGETIMRAGVGGGLVGQGRGGVGGCSIMLVMTDNLLCLLRL
jgi:hypothetical protein